jgi:drug/metabolite transporter (DMT)-like permease
MWEYYSNQVKGTLCCLCGILVISPDSLLVRLVSSLPDMEVIFYKYLFLASVLLVGMVASQGKGAIDTLLNLGWIGWITGVIWGISNFFLNYAFQHADVASVLVINAANPVFCTIASYLLIKEPMKIRTIVATVACFISILIIFSGSLGSGDKTGGSSPEGLVYALIASMTFGLFFALLRYAELSSGYE